MCARPSRSASSARRWAASAARPCSSAWTTSSSATSRACTSRWRASASTWWWSRAPTARWRTSAAPRPWPRPTPRGASSWPPSPAGQGYSVGKVLKAKDFVAERDSVGRGFMEQLYGVLDKQGMDARQRAELEDALGQLYLSSLPDLSWAKHGIHRKGTPGFSQDARRAFAQNVFHGASYLAKLRYGDQLQEQLAEMQKRVDVGAADAAFDSVKAQQVVDEMAKRHDAAMNPKTNALSTALTSLGFMFHLGLSPASAMVNLTQTALVAYPVMAARWGFQKAGAALLKASQEAARGRNDITSALSQDEKAAFDEAVRAGVVDVTMAHDLAGIAQGEDKNVAYKLRPVMRAASFLFHHAEKFNRQVTFVAAYRLARETGADSKAAYQQAVQATYDGHFDYSANNRPRVMQGNVARVLLLFKQYGQNMVYTLARNAQQSLRGATPEARAEARKALGGLLAMHAMAAGVLGLPMVTTLLAAASMLGGDDDEPWDAQVALQNLLADTFGQKPAEVLAHGLSRLTPWDISGRVGLDKLIFPDVQEGLEGQRLAESAMTAALGPVAGIGINVLKGLQEMSEGRYQRGLETMAPSVLRGPLKALRYETEGVKDKTGIVVQDEVDAAALGGQALGFSPSSVRNAYEGKSAIVGHDRALQARRSTLVEQFAMAAMARDEEGKAEAREAIQRFNEKNPGRRILPMQLAQSVHQREKRIRESKEGVYLPAKRREAVEQGRFAVAFGQERS
ncbi:MAG: PLxRFG domain-containing protein [Acidovorax sp.]